MESKKSENIRAIKTTEPKVTLLEEENFFRILAELPNIDEEKIRITLEKNATLITIMASDSTFQYKKGITLPCEVRFRKKGFSEGVLEIILEKIKKASFK